MNLKLDKPLAVFDIESTGVNPRADRIIDLAIVKLLPDDHRETFTWRVNPEMPIPAQASEIHGIYDDDVKDCPTFRQVAPEIKDTLKDCDLGGFNILRYDIPLLREEFLRVGVPFAVEGRRLFDAQRIFHMKEPRDLTAALQYYAGEVHTDAHGALADVEATIQVMEGQYGKYDDLPDNMDAMDQLCNPKDPDWIDSTGRLKWDGDEAVVNFGKNQGRSLRIMALEDPGFLRWILKKDFPRDTQQIVQDALNGKLPVRSTDETIE